MNNWMRDIEDFCDGYFYGGMNDFTIDEVVEDVGVYFMSNEAGKYAEKYLTTQMGEM
jgi:hypothetical protein